MSYHLLHVFKHGCVLSKDRGFLVCRGEDKSENRIPHEDVRAVIIAARGVTLTSNFVSGVLETDGIILHCNESYQPCGITAMRKNHPNCFGCRNCREPDREKSSFRMGWILTMFDLPVMTDKERKAATKFRNDLLDNGYLMIQFSVYARPCVSYEQMDTHIARIKSVVPTAGNVRLMFMTDEQWKRAYTVIGANYKNDNRAKDPTIPNQVDFWE